MSKIALLGDTHFGLRNGDKRFIEYFRKFYSEWFFPELESRGITTIFQLGDVYDKRTGNDSNAVAQANEYFFDRLDKFEHISFSCLVGNHDLYFKHDNSVNSPKLLLADYGITIYNTPTTVGEFDFIPWINDENQSEVFKFIKESKSKYCLGHYEISGFSMGKGVKGHDGLSPTIFNKYEQVFSGHYHTASKQGNIQYVGSPGEYTWIDCDDPKGFWILDTDTGETEFVVNPFTMFTKLYYDEDNLGTDNVHYYADSALITDHFVRVYVIKNTDIKKYNKFIESVNNMNPHELKIVEENLSTSSDVDTENMDVRDTPFLIDSYIDGLETELDKERLKTMMRVLYLDAQSQGE